MNNAVLALTILALRKLKNELLASANNAANLRGNFKHCSAFAELCAEGLTNSDGSAKDLDTLRRALAYVINERQNAGTFE